MYHVSINGSFKIAKVVLKVASFASPYTISTVSNATDFGSIIIDSACHSDVSHCILPSPYCQQCWFPWAA